MQGIRFFITTFSHGLAEERSLPDLEDAILLAADVRKLPSAEENRVPNLEDDDCNCDNVNEILRELSEERVKNRYLNQTISDILEEIEDMKKKIMRNEEKITDNQSSVFLLSRDVDDLQDDVASVTEDVERNSANITNVLEDVAAVQGDVGALQDDVVAVADDVESNSAAITTLGVLGSWCATKNDWSTVGTITYDILTYSDSNNMEITSTPLDSENPWTGLDINSVVLLFRLDAAVICRVHRSHCHHRPGLPPAADVPIPGQTLRQEGQDLTGHVREVHPGGAALLQHLGPGCLRLGGDRSLGPDGLHGHGPLCRLHRLRQTAKSQSVNSSAHGTPPVRCLLGIFLTGMDNTFTLMTQFVTPVHVSVRVQCQCDGQGGYQACG